MTQVFFWNIGWAGLLRPLPATHRPHLPRLVDRRVVTLQREGLKHDPRLMLIRDADAGDVVLPHQEGMDLRPGRGPRLVEQFRRRNDPALALLASAPCFEWLAARGPPSHRGTVPRPGEPSWRATPALDRARLPVAAIALTVAASARVEAARPRRLRLTVPRVVDHADRRVALIYFIFWRAGQAAGAPPRQPTIGGATPRSRLRRDDGDREPGDHVDHGHADDDEEGRGAEALEYGERRSARRRRTRRLSAWLAIEFAVVTVDFRISTKSRTRETTMKRSPR
ncbi:MAG: hypothetical protein U1F24_00655 [Alphaproteobacteria bacterium]